MDSSNIGNILKKLNNSISAEPSPLHCIKFYSDGSGLIKNDKNGKVILRFENEEELNYLLTVLERSLDYEEKFKRKKWNL